MTTLARLISWIGHPLVFVLASVAIVVGTQLSPRTGLPILLALLLSTLVPTAILLLSGVRSGRKPERLHPGASFVRAVALPLFR